MKYTILSFVSIILLVSCNKYNNFKSYNIIEMDSLNEELQEIICNYITNNSDNHSFVLVIATLRKHGVMLHHGTCLAHLVNVVSEDNVMGVAHGDEDPL